MVKQVRRLAIHKRLDPKASSTNATPYGKNMMKATQDNNTDSEGEGDKKGKGEFKFKNRWKNHRDREARSAAEGGGKGSGQRMLCNKLPNQSVFGQDDERVMPPHRPGGPANNFCVYFWHSEKCLKGDKCIYGGHVRKETYEKDPSKFKGVQLKDQKADKAKDQAASASAKEDTGAVAELAAKLGSAIDIMKGIAAAQQETSQAVEQFKKEQTASDIEKKKETEKDLEMKLLQRVQKASDSKQLIYALDVEREQLEQALREDRAALEPRHGTRSERRRDPRGSFRSRRNRRLDPSRRAL